MRTKAISLTLKSVPALLTGAALALSLASGASASTLYGATYTGAPTSDLYSLNQTTGAATLIGAIGKNVGDLTNVGGGLVGIDLSSNSLWTISTSNGAASNNVAITGTTGQITSIAWNPLTNVLYGDTTNAFSGSDILYSINVTTGVATSIGGLGATNLFGLGFGQDGALFGTDQIGKLYSVNTSTGSAGVVGNSGFCCLYDLASRPEDNVLFASPDSSNLLTLNKTTGAGTLVGPIGRLNIAGLAFVGGGVPEPTSWALMITGFGFAGGALRRRRAVIAA